MSDKNIVLIGMPGAGKSTIGVLLAKALKMPFIDTDLLIQQKENRYLQEIINTDGIEMFLKIEEEVLMNLNARRSVIATGGSAVYSPGAMLHLKQNGITVYLHLEYEKLEKRLKDIKSRGIAMAEGQSLLDLYNERIPLYWKYADLTIDCSEKNMEEIVIEAVNKSARLNI